MTAPPPVTLDEYRARAKEVVARLVVTADAFVDLAAPVSVLDLVAALLEGGLPDGGVVPDPDLDLWWARRGRQLTFGRLVNDDRLTDWPQLLAGFDLWHLADWLAGSVTADRLAADPARWVDDLIDHAAGAPETQLALFG